MWPCTRVTRAAPWWIILTLPRRSLMKAGEPAEGIGHPASVCSGTHTNLKVEVEDHCSGA